MSWGNWNFGGRTTRQQAANDFLSTGNFNTAFGGTACRGSRDCASGYACVGGRCVQKSSQQSSTGGTCGEGTGGGGCGGNSISLYDNEYNLLASGDAVSRQGTASGVIYKSYAWTPTYSDDGCTVTGCSLQECGGGLDSDCPQGSRQCRYDAFGTVNCFCEPPQPTGCSTFCTAYAASNGSDAEGCSGLSCDECSYCDEIFVSASGVCRPLQSGSPCHCKNEPIPDCHRCDENGTVVPDLSSCQECVTISNYECDSCGDGQTITKTCCQPLGTDGLSLTNKCQDLLEQDCQTLCPPPDPGGAPAGNCDGDCEPKTICQPGGCPDLPPNEPGHRNTASGCIEAGGQGCLLYYDCDVSDLPPECELCDCNCNNDCPNCQLCGADGKCYPDPTCEYTYFWEIAWAIFRYEEIASSAIGQDCTVVRTDYNSKLAYGTNGGEVGVDAAGLGWVAGATYTWNNTSYTCDYPAASGSWSDLRVQNPDGTLQPAGPIVIGQPRVNSGGQTVAYLWYDVGTIVGYGDTLGEAQANANAQFNALA